MKNQVHAVVPVVSIVNNHTTTTSLNVAEVFGKRHDDVLKAVRNTDVPEAFRLRNFAESSYKNAQGKEQPMYTITRDGFTILVMGFTGPKAMKFKLAYIDAFNRMEAELTRQSSPRVSAASRSRVSESHLGLKMSHRIKLLDIVCQISRLSGEPYSDDDIYLKYADLCDSMRSGGEFSRLGVSVMKADFSRFFESCCIFGRELIVSKSDLYDAYESFAHREGIPVQPRNLFFRFLRGYSPVEEYHRRMSDSGRVRYLRGVCLAGNGEGRNAQ